MDLKSFYNNFVSSILLYNVYRIILIMLGTQTHSDDYNTYYYQQYKKLYLASFVLSSQMKQLLKTKDELIGKLNKLEKKAEEFNEDMKASNQDKKKRFRRTADQIHRNFKCTVQRCQKLYGSQGSLHQHIKLKHPQLWVQPTHKDDSSQDQMDEGSIH